MGISYSSGTITVTGGKTSGTATSGGNTTMTDSGKSWSVNAYAERMVWIYDGTGEGQYRRIVSNTSTTLTVDVAWDTNPSSDSDYLVSYNFQDVDDALSSGISKSGSYTFIVTALLDINTTGFLHDTGKKLSFETGSNNWTWVVDENSTLGFGFLNADDVGWGGCQILLSSSYGGFTELFGSGEPTTDSGNFLAYSCVFTTNATYGFFYRLYRGSDQFVEFIDCFFHDFAGGGRVQGTNSRFVRNKFVNCTSNFTPFTTKTPMSSLEGNIVIGSTNSFYWFPRVSGTATITKPYGRNNTYAVTIHDANNPPQTYYLYIIDSDFDDWSLNWSGGSYVDDHFIYEQYNYIPTIVDASDQSPIEDCRIAIYDTNGSEIENDETESDGQLSDEEILLTAGTYRQADGDTRTDKTPHTVKIRAYGYIFQEFPITISSRVVTTLGLTENTFTSANKTTAAAYTGITVNGSTESITISEDHTLQEIYDYCQWWASQSGNIEYDVPITTADGVNFTMASGWDFTVSATYTVTATDQNLTLSGGGSYTITGDFTGIINDGTDYRVPVAFTGVVDGSRIYVERVSDSYEYYNDTISGTSLTIYLSITANTPVNVVIRKASSSPYYVSWESSGTVTIAAGLSFVVAQVLDE
jgi:hypothetical protein